MQRFSAAKTKPRILLGTGLDEVISLCLKAGRVRVLMFTAGLVILMGLADWAVGNTVSLAVLYMLPMILGAVVMGPLEIGALSLICALLRGVFDVPSSRAEVMLRFAFASAAYFAIGLFVAALVRNRELVVEHLAKMQREQDLRHEAEEQLSVMVESSPAAILTLDREGQVLAANQAADRLFGVPSGQGLRGRSIDRYLPVLADALRLESGPEGFRTAAQCQGRRDDGDVFLAHTWFSSYSTPHGTRLAAIIVDSSEEMREREELNLRHLMKYNRIAASGVSHEVRNLCAAISLLSGNLSDKHRLAGDEDYEGLVSLVTGLQRIASFDLHSRVHADVEKVQLQNVLDHLRIVIEPDWHDFEGRVDWELPLPIPAVAADPHGLLQVFLNLAKNSLRAVASGTERRLKITVDAAQQIVRISFEDSGPGVAAPEQLFQPFQAGADGSGLGLYISRAIMRSYGGDLRFDPAASGCRFVVELPQA
ncbi:MAG TPA: ATP-binding protein [Bryobacteraceae bacterium]|nr:ATP-binding protein [Bryobacteraceae bacterium]